jgi:hypothetical protein
VVFWEKMFRNVRGLKRLAKFLRKKEGVARMPPHSTCNSEKSNESRRRIQAIRDSAVAAFAG